VSPFYADGDGDGYGDGDYEEWACEAPAGHVDNADDCDDADEGVNPGAAESCNSTDDDCDGTTDEGVTTTYYRDADGDTYGTAGTTTAACSAPTGYVARDSDCDDTAASVNPGAAESCNATDDDCDGSTDEGVTTTYYRDSDNDDYGVSTSTSAACSEPSGYAAAAGDCNDASSSINPGAAETCNATDDDCDGSTDEGLATATYYRDADADGYGTSATTSTSCSTPTGYVSNADDCDDGSAAVSPAATETCNSTDDDCDGTTDEGVTTTYYLDADGDGYGVSDSTDEACTEPAGYAAVDGDCEDDNAGAYPGGTEDETAFGDEDCDGQNISNLSAADNMYDGIAYDEMGVAIAGAGDVTGDGYDDTIVGAPQSSTSCSTYYGYACPGLAAILPGGGASGWDFSTHTYGILLYGESDEDNAGAYVAGGFDFDGDGQSDVAVGADFNDDGGSNAGKAYVQLGPITGDMDLASADIEYIGETAGDYAGTLANAGDTDGDGDDELLVGARISSRSASYAGAAYLLEYSGAGTIDLSAANAIVTGIGASDYLAATMAGGDLDGDGISDIVLGASNAGSSDAASDPSTATRYYEGESYVFLGPVSGTMSASSADYTYVGENAGQRSGISEANCDADGDGSNDLLVHATYDGEADTAAGAVYLVLGPATSATLSSTLGAKLLGEDYGDFVGNATFVDPDNDGVCEVLVGAPTAEKAYMLREPSGTVDLGDSDWIFERESSGDDPGAGIANTGDLDGDGYNEIAIGDNKNDFGGTNAGTAYLLLGDEFNPD
jgi:hypothetical protein